MQRLCLRRCGVAWGWSTWTATGGGAAAGGAGCSLAQRGRAPRRCARAAEQALDRLLLLLPLRRGGGGVGGGWARGWAVVTGGGGEGASAPRPRLPGRTGPEGPEPAGPGRARTNKGRELHAKCVAGRRWAARCGARRPGRGRKEGWGGMGWGGRGAARVEGAARRAAGGAAGSAPPSPTAPLAAPPPIPPHRTLPSLPPPSPSSPSSPSRGAHPGPLGLDRGQVARERLLPRKRPAAAAAPPPPPPPGDSARAGGRGADSVWVSNPSRTPLALSAKVEKNVRAARAAPRPASAARRARVARDASAPRRARTAARNIRTTEAYPDDGGTCNIRTTEAPARATNNQITLRMHKSPHRKHVRAQIISNGMGAVEQSVSESSSVATVDDVILLQKINDRGL